MKKIILSALVISGAVAAHSQNLSFGPVVGVNHSWLTNNGNNRHFNPGLTTGLNLTYSFNPSWGIGGDLLFSMEGVKNRSVSSTHTNTRDANLNFVRIQPKLIHFFGNLGDAVRPKVFVGGSFGALVGGSTETMVSTNDEAAEVTGKRPSKDLYNSIDAGLLAGAGLNFRVGKATWLTTDVVYNNGLVDLTKSDNSWSASRSVSFNVGLTFPIGTITPQ